MTKSLFKNSPPDEITKHSFSMFTEKNPKKLGISLGFLIVFRTHNIRNMDQKRHLFIRKTVGKPNGFSKISWKSLKLLKNMSAGCHHLSSNWLDFIRMQIVSINCTNNNRDTARSNIFDLPHRKTDLDIWDI